MGNIKLGLNLEFARYENGSFDWAMDQAAEIGYKYVEPMVHWGRELLSAAGYFHSRSMLDDPLILRNAAEDRGLSISSLSSHAPLAKPEVAVEYFRQAIAGILLVSISGIGSPATGTQWALLAIAAVIIGGTPLTGGVGGISSAVIGILSLTVLTNALNLYSVSAYWQPALTGTAVLLAVGFEAFRSARKR